MAQLINTCKKCSKNFKPRRYKNRKSVIVYQIFCCQKCSHKFQVRENHSCWKKGYYLSSTGYLINSKTERYLHREVMESVIGRKLKSEEIVHHINGNKLDNSIQNLEITNHSEHMKNHFKDKKYKERFRKAIINGWKNRCGGGRKHEDGCPNGK